jgi:Domain of unknown function (DUF397)
MSLPEEVFMPDGYFTNNKHGYPEPPPLAEFGPFMIHDGTQWDKTDRNATNDQSCVAVAHHPSGAVVLADTKLNLADQTPLYFTAKEWASFTAGIIEGRL